MSAIEGMSRSHVVFMLGYYCKRFDEKILP